ncbi:MAG: septum formation family protein [Actinomycetota bacterium]|nr:septum formation family protein [Actinomycetota bacterium]
MAAFSGQNGDPDEESGGVIVAVVAAGLAMAGLVFAARAFRRRRARDGAPVPSSSTPELFITTIVLGVLAVLTFGSLLVVLANGTVGDGAIVDRRTLSWELAIASLLGLGVGFSVPAARSPSGTSLPSVPASNSNSWAKASLVLGLLSLPLLPFGLVAVAAIACGVVAVRRDARGPIHSRQALAGTVLGGLSLATVVFLVVTGLYGEVVLRHSGDTEPLGEDVVGTCFDSKIDELTDCEALHDYEFFAVLSYEAAPGAQYPGRAALEAYADDHCHQAFLDYVGIGFDGSDIEIGTDRPTKAAWRHGSRQIVCLAGSDRRVGSLRRAQ